MLYFGLVICPPMAMVLGPMLVAVLLGASLAARAFPAIESGQSWTATASGISLERSAYGHTFEVQHTLDDQCSTTVRIVRPRGSCRL